MRQYNFRKFERFTHNLTVTFKHGFVSEVINHGRFGTIDRKIDPMSIMFIYDMSKYVKSKNVPLAEMSQWIHACNENVNIQMTDQNTIILHNIKL